eukprot:TRINITY_DN15208_c0_g1_i1.p2 TRINITY_DN15208_c0_g1~~TRINITY_DN15208_c0_g1_i1.p2  ORF type:complete len:105 (-),score=32.89 TRINITY_DN15208_c0_g1_i1:141-455(-)
MHYLMLYVLFDLANEDSASAKYADSYKARFRVEREVWEKVHGLWMVDCLLGGSEVKRESGKAASLLLANSLSVTNWDRQILRVFREFKDSENVLSYSKHLEKSK